MYVLPVASVVILWKQRGYPETFTGRPLLISENGYLPVEPLECTCAENNYDVKYICIQRVQHQWTCLKIFTSTLQAIRVAIWEIF